MLETFHDNDLAKYRRDSATGIIINDDHRRVAQVIHDYDPNLEVQWIPPDQRTEETDQHFRVICYDETTGHAYEVFRFREDQMDHRILAKIWAADQKRHDVTSELDLMDQARELLKAKEWEETKEKMRDFALTRLKSPLHTFKHNGVEF